MASTAVIGLGNILLRDEGIGVHAVNAIRERYSFSPDVEIIDGGTLGLDLLPILDERDRILFIDAVNFGKEPGHIGILNDEEIPSTVFAKLSVHHIGLSDVLMALKLLDRKTPQISLIGVQPESLELGLEMTACISGKMDEIIEKTIAKLKEWNITCVSPSPVKSSA